MPPDEQAHEPARSLAVRATGAARVLATETVQVLWSGYGEIVRCRLEGGSIPSVIVKHVRWPTAAEHPRGWSTDRSHQRKVESYRVETEWYRRYSERCDGRCRVPQLFAAERRGDETFLVLEDLDAADYDQRRSKVGRAELEACLSWLASFHATFLGTRPDGLWTVGTYWHLDTRPDELAALPEGRLKAAAPRIDHRLNQARFQTLVHGDAKLANFCFTASGREVAAVDFQYVGGGCGMKDVAYFISSCLDEVESERQEASLLDFYFDQLRQQLGRHGDIAPGELEREWRELYPVAWTDFYRFLQGWSPGHWKIHRYSERLAREVLDSL